MNVAGTLEQIKETPGKFGTMYSMKVDGKWYGTRASKPKVSIGNVIKFEATQNGDFLNADAKTIEVVPSAEPVQVKMTSAGETRSLRNEADEKKQAIISRQAARNTAVETLKVAASIDAIPIAKTAKDKLGLLLALLDQMTEDNFNYSMTGSKKGSPVAEATPGEAAPVPTAEEAGW